MSVLVTGANGLIGKALTKCLARKGIQVAAITRREIGYLDANTLWDEHLEGVDAIVHLAARVHVMHDSKRHPLSIYRQVNRDGTIQLARSAIARGIRRFVFISTIKVNGDKAKETLAATSPINPGDPYAISKFEAEQGLAELNKDLDLVTLRPPLVYGPNVKGNFIRLIQLVDCGIPLPLASVQNRRSFIGLANLTDAIHWSLKAPSGVYFPNDKQDQSTADLINAIARLLNKPARLFPVAPQLLTLAGRLIGKHKVTERLLSTLTSDGLLPGWSPPESFESGLEETIRWYKGTKCG